MAAVKIKADGSIVLPKALRRQLKPKLRYEAVPMEDGVMIMEASDLSLKEVLAKTNDGVPAPSDEQIQEWIEDSRRKRRYK